MTVNELIAKLSQFDGNETVTFTYEDQEYHCRELVENVSIDRSTVIRAEDKLHLTQVYRRENGQLIEVVSTNEDVVTINLE
jgi:hypothetical protein